MEKHKRGFYKFIPLLALAAFAAQDALAKIDLEYPKDAVTEGGVFFLTAKSDEDLTEVRGRFQGNPVEFFRDPEAAEPVKRFTALVGVNYGTAPGASPFELHGKVKDKPFNLKVEVPIQAGVFPSEKLRVAPRMIEPRKKDKLRITKENARVRSVYATVTLNRFWDLSPVMPVDSEVTSVFGSSRVYNGKKTNAHLGTDLRAPTGTKIVAPLTGQVALARNLFYTGNTVILDHGFGLFTVYGHMSKLKVKEGTILKKGQLMGLSGATGRVSGPHLHWAVHLNGGKVDPLVLVNALKSKGNTGNNRWVASP